MRTVTNLFLIVLIGAMLVDTMPFDQALRGKVDAALDKTGLWQGTWNLFAPDPDRQNSYISAVIVFADGAKTDWRSPDWSTMSVWQRFVNFRRMEYYDSIHRDENRGAWDALAAYLARHAHHPSRAERAVTVTLTRHWATIPTLVKGHSLIPAGPYRDFSGSYAFHSWTVAARE